ncbi:hypothetical protein HDK77DRAFT_486634 [Phyllosticta capitalensis]
MALPGRAQQAPVVVPHEPVPNNRASLLGLPRELRDMIYAHFIEYPNAAGFYAQCKGLSFRLWHPDDGWRYRTEVPVRRGLDVAVVCKQIRAEVHDFIFNRFEVEIDFGTDEPIERTGPTCLLDLHRARRLTVFLPVHRERREKTPDQPHGARKRLWPGPFSIKHDWTSPRKGTVIESAACGKLYNFQDKSLKALWLRFVAQSPGPSGKREVRDNELQSLYPHRLWRENEAQLENVAFGYSRNPKIQDLFDIHAHHRPFFQLFRRLAEKGHCLEELNVVVAIMTPTQDWVPWNCSQMDRKCQLTRSDYGAYPYLRALSELGKRSIRKVSVGFGESNKDDSQGSRHFDYALMSNWLRRQIEDSDEASALRDFPGCGQSSYDECFPKLPASTAAETEATPADLAPPSPLDVSFNEEWFDRFSQSRYRLLDDQHIFGELFQRLWESDANEDAAWWRLRFVSIRKFPLFARHWGAAESQGG